MNPIPAVQQFLECQIPDFQNAKYLLAVSGGLDSMALLFCFQSLKLQFSVAHVNFGLRGEESDQDENFIVNYCQNRQIPYFIFRPKTKEYALKKHYSTQVAARNLRYQWFHQLLNKENLDYLVTAHHLNDNVETLIYTLVKNSYYQVFEEIPIRNGKILRPFSYLSKSEIYNFVIENQIPYREDSSNASNDYFRNQIRNEIMPLLKKINPSIEQHLILKYQNQQRKEKWIQDLCEEYFLKMSKKNYDFVTEIQITDEFLASESRLIIFLQYLLEKFRFRVVSDSQVFSLIKNSTKSKKLEDKNYWIFREKDGISIISKRNHFPKEGIRVEKKVFSNQYYEFEISEEKLPVLIRSKKTGDKYLGQKMKDYLYKKNYPAWAKQFLYVVENQKGEIIFVQKDFHKKQKIV